MGAGAYAALEGSLTANQIFLLLGLIFFIGVAVVWLTDFNIHDKKIQTLASNELAGDFAPHG